MNLYSKYKLCCLGNLLSIYESGHADILSSFYIKDFLYIIAKKFYSIVIFSIHHLVRLYHSNLFYKNIYGLDIDWR